MPDTSGTTTPKPQCQHRGNIVTFRSIPARSECVDCGAEVERRWVTKAEDAT